VTAAPPRPVVLPVATADRVAPATQQQRRLRYSATLARLRARAAVSPAGSIPRLQVRGAANLLTALGVRVDVVQPASPWPRDRAHHLVIANGAGLLGDLALLVAVPRSMQGWADMADRVLPLRPFRRAARSAGGAVDCPVTIAYRSVQGPLLVPPRTLDDVVAIRGLVIEVRLLATRAGAERAA
jgi:hypothetical protein